MVTLYTLVKLNENSIRCIFYVACNIHNAVFFTSCFVLIRNKNLSIIAAAV